MPGGQVLDSDGPIEDDVNVESYDELNEFCQRLIDHTQFGSERQFRTGSSVEIPGHGSSAEYCKLIDALDMDVMHYLTSYFVFPRDTLVPETYNGLVIRIYTSGIHAGYANLIVEKNNKSLLLGDMYKGKNDTRHGPAMRGNSIKFIEDSDCDNIFSPNMVQLCDEVYAVHSPCWPQEASEWITRPRSYGFPSNYLIKQVVGYGCDFVQVSHDRLDPDDAEWRFSFSKAELIIISSWTIPQKIVYSTLSLIKKMIANRVGGEDRTKLCSYYFKTSMLWACEEKSPDFWCEDLLLDSVCELLICTATCLKLKLCRNYFIPENNMMDHLYDIDLSADIEVLFETLQSGELVQFTLDTCRVDETIADNDTYDIELPGWIKRSLLIFNRIYSPRDNYIDLFTKNMCRKLKNAVYYEFSDIFRGLCSHQKAVSTVDLSNNEIHISAAENHFKTACRLYESQERCKLSSCDKTVANCLLPYWYMNCAIDGDSPQADNQVEVSSQLKTNSMPECSEDTQMKMLQYSQSTNTFEENISSKISVGEKVNILRFRTYHFGGKYVTDNEYYKEWPTRSPTVNITWFIAKAYLANLYYTTQRDYAAAIQICMDIVQVSRQSYENKWFAEETFPVILSTQLASVYDEEVQELLGFYSLCTFVFDETHLNSSVYLGVCPVQFALYLKARCSVCNQQLYTDRYTAAKFMKEYVKHISPCSCNFKVNNGILTIQKCLRNWDRKHLKLAQWY